MILLKRGPDSALGMGILPFIVMAAKSEPEGISRLCSRSLRFYPGEDFLTPGAIAPAGFGQDKGDAKKGGDVATCVHRYRAEIRRGHNLRLGENN